MVDDQFSCRLVGQAFVGPRWNANRIAIAMQERVHRFMNEQMLELQLVGVSKKRHVNHPIAEAVGHGERSAGVANFDLAFVQAIVLHVAENKDERLAAPNILIFLESKEVGK